jgi:copper chaperone CopZ
MEQDKNQNLTNQLELVHVLPGRLRLRVLGEDFQTRLKEISQNLREQEGVESVKIKEKTGSIVVIFDPQIISVEQLKTVLSPFNLLSTSLSDQEDLVKSSGKKLFSQVMSLTPLLFSWLLVKRFNLSGLKAIATYLIATGIIGELMEQVQVEMFFSPTHEKLSGNTAKPKQISPLNEEGEPSFKIRHHLPGRLRLGIPKICQDKNYAQKFQGMLEQDERVIGVRVNQITGSVLVNYKQEALSGLNDQELTLILSNWMELIDSVIALETSTSLTTEAENALEGDGNLSEVDLT